VWGILILRVWAIRNLRVWRIPILRVWGIRNLRVKILNLRNLVICGLRLRCRLSLLPMHSGPELWIEEFWI